MLMLCGGVAELAYAADLKSAAARLKGSSPFAPTIPLNASESHRAITQRTLRSSATQVCRVMDSPDGDRRLS